MHEKTDRLQILVSPETKNFFRCIHPDRGFLTNTINTFLNTIANDCKSLGVTFYSSDNLVKLESIIRERTAPRVTPDGRSNNGPRSVERIRESYKNVKNKSARVQQDAVVGVEGTGKRRRRTEEEREIS